MVKDFRKYSKRSSDKFGKKVLANLQLIGEQISQKVKLKKLDSYGTQSNFCTIEALARGRAIRVANRRGGSLMPARY